MFGIMEIIACFTRIGASLTEEQVALLKWRISDDSKKYYSDKENKDFYEAVLSGDTDIVDAIRKEKQKRIDDLKNELLSVVLVLLIPFIASCSLFSPATPDYQVLEQQWDSNSLTTKDKTYEFSDQDIKLKGEIFSTKFNGHWYIVNEDFIKTHNENQDTLIKALEKTKELKTSLERKTLYTIIGFVVAVILLFIFMFKAFYKGDPK